MAAAVETSPSVEALAGDLAELLGGHHSRWVLVVRSRATGELLTYSNEPPAGFRPLLEEARSQAKQTQEDRSQKKWHTRASM